MHPVSWLALSLSCTALAQVAFKSYFKRRSNLALAAAVGFFLLVPFTTYQALKGMSLATVYVATAASQLLVVLISLAFMGEHYSRRQYLGFSLVLAGIIVYNL
jgi:drug/metabolite transporter (DMT)-like permease